jgi:hypothetical protein
MKLPHTPKLVLAAILMMSTACVDTLDTPDTDTDEQAGMVNGMVNGIFHPEGLTTFLTTECPILADRLLVSGGFDLSFPASFSTEIAKTDCEKFIFYTAELMLPYGTSMALKIGTTTVGTFWGAMNMQSLVQQVYSGYSFVQHGFKPAYPVARKIVTQGYAALTNQYQRTVSYKTGVSALDAHRATGEDNWPREFTQIVPFTAAGLSAMASDSTFLAQQPDFFNACNSSQTNYNYVRSGTTGGCPVPVVVRGNIGNSPEVIPGRSCRILQPGETAPVGTTLYGDVIVPTGGCPIIYYAGRTSGATIYDDRTLNPTTTTDGCDVVGPSNLTRCTFDLVGSNGTAIPADRLAYYVFNVQPQ